MTQRKWIRLFTVVALAVSGCSAHNPLIVSNKNVASMVSEAKFPPHSGKVFCTEQSLPSSVKFELIATIDVGKVWYGSSKDVYTSMALRARQLGANAVIQIKTWHQPSGFSWAAPHGSGQAVHIDDTHQLDVLNLEGNWQ